MMAWWVKPKWARAARTSARVIHAAVGSLPPQKPGKSVGVLVEGVSKAALLDLELCRSWGKAWRGGTVFSCYWGMKWFFALHEGAPHFGAYADMVKVAVMTAQRWAPELEPCLLYDGAPNAFTAWLEARGVAVLTVRSRLYGALVELAERTGNGAVMDFGPGVFLRMEIPKLCAERGWATSGQEGASGGAVLYTDCDVMFTGDPGPWWPELGAAFFAVAPEDDPADAAAMNSGVMLMNPTALLAMDAAFEAAVREMLAECVANSWDQHAYRKFFRHGWRSLPAELNWKPYWGESAGAAIVHFHGPKPFLRAQLAAGGGHVNQRVLMGGGFAAYCAQWDAAAAAGAAE